MQPIIEIKHLGKKYKITHQRGGYVTLRDVLTNIMKSPFHFAKDKTKQITGIATKEEFWALKDVNLEIQKGEVIGIIGRNGAGKSTLLKVLTGITPPTKGEVIMHGKVASLLEVGTGFHPELTGRENIFLNGAILGMTKKEIASKFDKIVAFSGVEKFLDTPVKYYSSGMYVRLAFSVAAHLEPDILLVDEVLAVGDAEFQKKCLGKMEEVTKEDGRTIIFVSHNMAAIERLCKKCVWLQNGSIKAVGDSKKIISEYLEAASTNDILPSSKIGPNQSFSFEKVSIKDVHGKNCNSIKPNESFVVEVNYYAEQPIQRPYFWIDVGGAYGHLFGASMIFDDLRPSKIEGHGFIACKFSGLTLLPQTYTITLRAFTENGLNQLTTTIKDAVSFQVVGTAEDYGMKGPVAGRYLNHDTPIIPKYTWIYQDGTQSTPKW